MQSRVEWQGETSLIAINSDNQSIELDWDNGPNPMQITLQMVGSCAIADVVIGLKEREFTKVWVELEATRVDTTPRHFSSIKMVFHVTGNAPQKLVERIAIKAVEKYCSVAHSLHPDIEITTAAIVHSID
ncbi:MAG: OsmC family protein [Candidatus Poseidoniaceae archaeon]|nr:OsmC family protein [Candidatus Poseidoniaceae archaeon]